MIPQLVSTHEAANALGIPYTSFVRWVNDGKVKPDFENKRGGLFRPRTVHFIGSVLEGYGRAAVHEGRLA